MNMNIEFVKPGDIEKRSMAIITGELEKLGFDFDKYTDAEMAVLRRCIHTSADFDYRDNLVMSKGAVDIGIKALKEGVSVLTDTNMAKSGISKVTMDRNGGEVLNFIREEDVIKSSKERGVTRSSVCMEKAADLKKDLIIAIGNAPTALIRLYELIKEGKIKPVLVIGTPVGFVNVVESKELFMELDVPYIIARGRKGGSNIAAAIVNAMLYFK
ncbi:MAG: precorrin-8X methylmutase [Clostridiales bacterium]|nr:MAG: precorrin-8X methylmutase [Clostridiales bacterium]